MILVDTSVWSEHLRHGNERLARLLDDTDVLAHPWCGALALSSLRNRDEVIGLLRSLPQATTATEEELLTLIDAAALYGTGVGYVDAQLLASCRMTPGTRLCGRRTTACPPQRHGSGSPTTRFAPTDPYPPQTWWYGVARRRDRVLGTWRLLASAWPDSSCV